MIAELPDKMRLVMSLYYQDRLKMREIAAQLNLTESRVSQIHTNAVARLRKLMKDHG
jgi:RNA polymerase sigma factor for flagellar operon FliA